MKEKSKVMHGNKPPSKSQFDSGARELYELVESEITGLFKAFLDMITQLSEDEDGTISRIAGILPRGLDAGQREEITRLVEGLKVIDENKYKQLRRRVLSIGNDAIRAIMSTVYEDFVVEYQSKVEIVMDRPGQLPEPSRRPSHRNYGNR